MSTWTFQNTQNASGWPAKADAPGRDIYLAYPDPDGPLSTPEWEAVREGIEDHKLLYQLSHFKDEAGYEKYYTSRQEIFQSLKKKLDAPGPGFGEYNG